MTDMHKDNSTKSLEEDTNKPAYVPNKKKPFIIISILVFIALVFLSKNNVFSPESSIRVTGKIISPLNKSMVGKEIFVIGKTKNVNAGQYIWLAFDNPEFRTCWPRIQVQGNTEFSVTILEKSLKDDLRLSLYVINEKRHKKWIEWQSTQKPPGVKMPSGRKYLDHVNIILK